SQNDGRPDSPACLLFIAICHGAVSDQFKRIRQLVDICQAARHLPYGLEEEKFAEMVKRQRAEPFTVSALDFAGRIFAEPRCHDIAREFGSRWAAHATRTLVPPSIFSATVSTDSRAIWRRKTLRELLMRA
ncbi:MAG: hypothetical protein ACR2PG_10595, partial [Hyphomicrobiaceae bacterium]